MRQRKTYLVDISPDKPNARGIAKRIERTQMEDAIRLALGSRLFVLDEIQGEETPNGIRVFKATRYDKGRIADSYVVSCARINPETHLLESSGRLVVAS